ncbi:MAG: tetratricopeptide repeat protein, partial [Sphingobacteriales bacterium]
YFIKNVGGPAKSDYEQALLLNPKLTLAQMKIGKLLGQARNYPQALEALKQAQTIDPNFAPVYRELGELYYRTGKIEEARDSYKTYVKLADNDIQARGRYAAFLYLSKDFPAAISYADEVLAQDPKNYIMLRIKGYSQYEAEKYDDARKTMEQYFATVPADKILGSDYENYGNILAKLDKNTEALENLNKALAADSTNPSIHTSLANLYQKNKDYKKAAHHFQQRINAGQGVTLQDYFSLGQAHYLGKNYAAADSAFSKITEVAPDIPFGYTWRARAMSSLDPESTKGLAREHYEKVVEKGAAEPAKNKAALIEAYEYLGYYYALKKDNAQARSYFQKAKELGNKALTKVEGLTTT